MNKWPARINCKRYPPGLGDDNVKDLELWVIHIDWKPEGNQATVVFRSDWRDHFGSFHQAGEMTVVPLTDLLLVEP